MPKTLTIMSARKVVVGLAYQHGTSRHGKPKMRYAPFVVDPTARVMV